MRRFISVLLFACYSVLTFALHVECVGKAVLLTNQGDTLLLFASSPELKTLQSIGEVDWYKLPDTITPIQTGTDYLYPEHGEGYMLKIEDKRDVFWVFDYDSLRVELQNVEAKLSCENTELYLEGTIPAMDYTNLHGKRCLYPRSCRVMYMDAQWDAKNEAWSDSVVVIETDYEKLLNVGAPPVPTDFTITDLFAEMLSLDEDSLQTIVYAPIALKAHPTCVVTTRGNDEPSNEVERPIEPTEIVNRSAPLIITFKSNALNADYYDWVIYQGSDRILQRSEAQHQYTFEEPGNYRAVVTISNQYQCALDSIEFDISVSESMLLVPNVFTPNGDGMNDEFRVVYRSIKEFHCWVYNRWGHLVYEWTDPAKGWDGTIGGKPAAEGAYYYVIRALGTDAETDYMAKPIYTKKLKKQELPIGVYQLSGDINLIRGGK